MCVDQPCSADDLDRISGCVGGGVREDAPLLPAGGRAFQEMTRISASPYSMWRDIAISNKKNLEDALWKIEQRLAHIRREPDDPGIGAGV